MVMGEFILVNWNYIDNKSLKNNRASLKAHRDCLQPAIDHISMKTKFPYVLK
jgi:hypothetical protein